MLSVFLSSFESFIVNDVHPVKFNSSPPLAKRVVFITIDGLGEHILRRTKHKYVEFLTWGQMGLVKAEPPTETRPRHVALLAGFNEDIFNIRNGTVKPLIAKIPWKTNIRPFNAILHNAQFSWAYGDPVALSSFKVLPDDPRNQRLKLEHYNTASYSPTFADDFVLNKFKMVKCTLGLGRMMASAIFLLAVASVMEHGTVSPMHSCILKRVHNMFVKTKSLIETSFSNPFTIVFSSLSKIKVEQGIENYKHQSTFPSLFSDYNEELNYREMITLNFSCIVCEFFLGDYATAGRRLLAKLFKSTGPQRRHILRLPLAILQAFLIVILSFEKSTTIKGFDEPRCFAATGALLTVDLAFDETVRRKGKYRFSSSVCTFTRSILVHIQPSDRCCEGKFNSSESSHSHSKLKTVFLCFMQTGQISFWEWALLELRVMLFNFLLLNTYMFGLNIYSTSAIPTVILTDCFIKSVESLAFLPIIIIKLLALICSIANSVLTLKFVLWILKRMIIPYFQNSLQCKTDCYSYIKIPIKIPFNNTMSFFPINGPFLALFIAYVYSTWKRELQRVSALRAQALVWILFTPLTFAQGTANLGYTDSWSQIVKHLAYFIYLTVGPLICAFTLKRLSHILHLSDA
uniref:GPI ethanolamine phosphate transferase 1 n=1 Tax=Echinococcus canadensis TaxID=519352 RepID=A0A915EW50_9CEST